MSWERFFIFLSIGMSLLSMLSTLVHLDVPDALMAFALVFAVATLLGLSPSE